MLKHTIPLVSGRWTAEIAPDRGANPIRVQYGGEDILIPGIMEHIERAGVDGGGRKPVSDRLTAALAREPHRRRPLFLPRHGVHPADQRQLSLRQSAWQPVSPALSGDGAIALLRRPAL